MSLQLADRISTTVASGYSAGGGSLVVAWDANLPTSGDFYIIVEAEGANTEEVLKVTANDGASPSTLTVTGAQASTAASDHGVGAVVRATAWPKAAYEQFRADTVLSGAYASLPAAGGEGRIYKATDSPLEYRDNGSTWDPFLPSLGYGVLTLPTTGDFAWINQGTAVAGSSSGHVVLTSPHTATPNVHVLKKSAPATPYTITAIFRNANNKNYHNVGLCFRQSSDGKLVLLRQVSSSVAVSKLTNPTTFSADYTSFTVGGCKDHVLRIADDGANRICSYWHLGEWVTIHTVGRTDFLTADEVGVSWDAENNATPNITGVFGWFHWSAG